MAALTTYVASVAFHCHPVRAGNVIADTTRNAIGSPVQVRFRWSAAVGTLSSIPYGLNQAHECFPGKLLGTSSEGVAVVRSQGVVSAEANATAESGSDGLPEADSEFIRSKLAVFVSGGGSNFRALHSSTLNNSIYGDVTVVISDKPGCKGCDYAREHDLEILTYPPRSSNKQNANAEAEAESREDLSAAELVESLRDRGIDYLLLAGYLKLLPLELVRAYPRSILNIHPSLLPSFGGKGYYGVKVHEAVIKSGARFSGATVHFVDEKFDTGPIVAQRIVPVLSDDTPQDLAAKVLKEERLLYSEVVAALCEDRIFWRDDGVPLLRKSWDEAEYY